jgi:serine/threonine protein kinase/Tfp pilus assembly protein PilF
MIGKTISQYRIIEKLGEGGMGEVYLAEDTELNRKVALKFLPTSYANDPDFRARFKREAQAAAALNHPNIITIFDVAEHEGRPYFSMEYVQGPSLKDALSDKETPIEKIVDLAIQVAEGLAAAHAAGVLHRDIKPQNILLDSRGRVRILDFGLAKVLTDSMITDTGSTLGTVAYMSPEQAQNVEADERSDIFSFGTVLYEMVAGQLPFKGEHHAAIIYSIVNENHEPLARYKADVPDMLQNIVNKALRKERDTRYQSTPDLLADLKELKRQYTTDSLLSTAGIKTEGPKRRSRTPLIAALVIVALVAVAAIAAIQSTFMGSVKDEEPAPELIAESRWKNSIAVLPFRDFSPGRDQEYFCHGMTDAIINKLAGVEDLKTISLSSAMQYKDSEQDIKTIGRDLNVATILEGSIQREENRIRLSAQLINVEDDAHLWSETYDRELESVFAIQDEISQAIVDVLKLRLMKGDESPIGKRYTENIDAYNAYVQGRYLWNKRTEENLLRSVEYFHTAIELDPNYALAYAGLADAWGVMPSNTGYPLDEAVGMAKEAAARALEIDDDLADGHASMGLALMIDRDLEGAEPEFLRAIELNPGCAYAHYWYSMTLGNLGRQDERLRELEAAYEFDPLSVVILSALMIEKAQTGDMKEAAGLFDRAVEIEPKRSTTYTNYAGALMTAGRPEEALLVHRRALEADTTYKQAHNHIAYIYGHMEDFDRAIVEADKAVHYFPDDANYYDTRGDIYAIGGKIDSAIEDYSRAIAINDKAYGTLVKLAACYLVKRDYQTAESMYVKMMESEDPQIKAASLAGRWTIPLYQGKYKEALEMMEEPLPRDAPETMKAVNALNKHMTKFLIYIDREEFDLALAQVQPVRDILDLMSSQDMTRMRDAEAAILAFKGDYASAEDTLRSLREDLDFNYPDQINAYRRIQGIVELAKGNANAAATYLEQGETESGRPLFEARFFLGQAYLEAGKYEEAVDVLEKTVRRYDDRRMRYPTWSVTSHYYLGLAYESAGRIEDALAQYGEFLEYWKDADRDLPVLIEAKARVAGLRAEGNNE